jgi:signal transduction histidine kinase
MGGLCGAFTIVYIVFFYVFQDASEIADSNLDGYLEVLLLALPIVVLLAVTMWLWDSDTETDLRPPIVGWTVGSALIFAIAIHTALFVIEPRFDRGEQWLILLLSTGFGASAGSVTGVMGIISKQRERDRNRNQKLAQRRKREREQLEYLNQYLRHEVLNEVTKISGYANLLDTRSDLDDDDTGYLNIIQHSSEDIAVFIESIREILDTTDHDPRLEPVDVTAVVDTELTWLRRSGHQATFDLIGDEEAYVLAGDLLDRVIVNLVENALEHNPGRVSVSVRIDTTDQWTTIRIRDDGTGISDRKRATLFKPPKSGDHGYGLFLIQNIVELYGGQLVLEETDSSGTTFLVQLRPATNGPSTGRPMERSDSHPESNHDLSPSLGLRSVRPSRRFRAK